MLPSSAHWVYPWCLTNVLIVLITPNKTLAKLTFKFHLKNDWKMKKSFKLCFVYSCLVLHCLYWHNGTALTPLPSIWKETLKTKILFHLVLQIILLWRISVSLSLSLRWWVTVKLNGVLLFKSKTLNNSYSFLDLVNKVPNLGLGLKMGPDPFSPFSIQKLEGELFYVMIVCLA